MPSGLPHSAVHQAVEELVSAKDIKKIKIRQQTLLFFESQLSGKDLSSADISVLITGVKFFLQHWEAGCSREWETLCFYLAGWLCVAVRLYGDDEALYKTVRNLQFVVSKGTKAEQSDALWFVLREAVNLVQGKRSVLLSIEEGGCGKSVAMLAQGVAQFLGKNGVPSVGPDGSDRMHEPSWRKSFVAFLLSQQTAQMVLRGVPAPASVQILTYASDAVLTHIVALTAEVNEDAVTSNNSNTGKSGKVGKKNASNDDTGDAEYAMNLFAEFVTYTAPSGVSPVRLLDWATKQSRILKSNLIWTFSDTLISHLKNSEMDMVDNRLFDHILSLVVSLMSSMVGQGVSCSGSTSRAHKLWIDVLSLIPSSNRGDLSLLSQHLLLVTESVLGRWLRLLPLTAIPTEGSDLMSASASIPHLLKSVLTPMGPGDSGAEAVSGLLSAMCALLVQSTDEEVPQAMLDGLVEIVTGFQHSSAVITEVFVTETGGISATAAKLMILLKIMSPCYKHLASGFKSEHLQQCTMSLYSCLLGVGYTSVSQALIASSSVQGSSLAQLSAAISRWKSVLAYAVARAPPSLYQLATLTSGPDVISGLMNLMFALTSPLPEEIYAIFPVKEVIALIHAAVARQFIFMHPVSDREATSDSGFVSVVRAIREDLPTGPDVTTNKKKSNIKQPRINASAISNETTGVKEVDTVLANLNTQLYTLSRLLDASIRFSASHDARLDEGLGPHLKMVELLATSLLDRIAIGAIVFLSSRAENASASHLLAEWRQCAHLDASSVCSIGPLDQKLAMQVAVKMLDTISNSVCYLHDVHRLLVHGWSDLSSELSLNVQFDDESFICVCAAGIELVCTSLSAGNTEGEHYSVLRTLSNMCLAEVMTMMYEARSVYKGDSSPTTVIRADHQVISDQLLAELVNSVKSISSRPPTAKSKTSGIYSPCTYAQCCEGVINTGVLMKLSSSLGATSSPLELDGLLDRSMTQIQMWLDGEEVVENSLSFPVQTYATAMHYICDHLALQGLHHHMASLVRFVSILCNREERAMVSTLYRAQFAYNGIASSFMSGAVDCRGAVPLVGFLCASETLLRMSAHDSGKPIGVVYHCIDDIVNIDEKQGGNIGYNGYMELFEAALSHCGDMKTQCNDDCVLEDPLEMAASLHAWLCLLGAKCVMCLFVKYNAAIALVKRGLRYLNLKTPPSGLCPTMLLIRFEAMVLIGELYEQMGEVDRCLPYFADARSAALAVRSHVDNGDSSYLMMVYSMHIQRVWHRIGSSRWKEVHDLLLKCEPANTVGSGGSSTIAALGEISRVINSIIDGSASKSKSLYISSFRHLWFQYDTVRSSSVAQCHTAMDVRLRAKFHQALGDEHISLTTLGELSSICSDSFELSRVLRRRMVTCAVLANGSPFVPFYFATTACSTSVRPNKEAKLPCQLDGSCAKQTKASRAQPGSGLSLMDNSLLTTENNIAFCIADQSIQNMFRSFQTIRIGADMSIRKDTKPISDSLGVSVVCLSIDMDASRLLMSRNDVTFGPLTISCPLSETLAALLQKWTSLTDENVEQLTATLHSSGSEWSASDKKKWWDARGKLDRNMEVFVTDLTAEMGVWRCFLCETSTDSALPTVLTNSITAIDTSMLKIILQTCGVATGSSSRAVRAGKIENTTGRASTSLQDSVEPWLKLLLCSMDASWLEPPLSLQECHSAMLMILGKGLRTPDLPLLCPRAPEGVQWAGDVDAAVDGLIAAFLHLQQKFTEAPSGEVRADNEAVAPVVLPQLSSMTVVELKTALKDLSLPTTGKKAELVARLQSATDASNSPTQSSSDDVGHVSCAGQSGQTHTILILDENLQSLPWENTPTLSRRSCSRIPNLNVLFSLATSSFSCSSSVVPLAESDLEAYTDIVELSTLLDGMDMSSPLIMGSGASLMTSGSFSVDGVDNKGSIVTETKKRVTSTKAKKKNEDTISGQSNNDKALPCWYCIDPEANLPRTRETMSAFLLPLADKYHWTGLVAKLPVEDAVRTYHETNQLFIYSGHGAGDKLMRSHSFRKLSSCPAAFLWGCSSGKLHGQGIHDPSGTVLHYLASGSVFVIGNLWDVTDVDIDKLSMKCMGGAIVPVEGSSEDVATALVKAREACKLKCAVGYAPVIYGLPARIVL